MSNARLGRNSEDRAGFARAPLTGGNKTGIRNIQGTHTRGDNMVIRLARESLAFVSVAGFVWMMCHVAQFAA